MTNHTINAWADVDGVQSLPIIGFSGASNFMMAGQSWLVPSGRRALRVAATSSPAGAQMDPLNCTLSWIIAPQGGIAN